MTGRIGVVGFGLWAPGYRDARALLADPAQEQEASPTASLLPARAHARASLLTRMLCEATAQATRGAEIEPGAVATVFGSSHGEIQRMMELVTTPTDRPVSPLRFQVSVHNAAAGLLSIATGNRGFSTSVSAGDDTLLAALWEAAALLHERGGQVVVAVGDERVPEPLGERAFSPMAAAFVLTAGEHPGHFGFDVPGLDAPRAHASDDTSDASDASFTGPLAGFRAHPCRAAVLLARALAAGEGGVVPLAGPAGRPATLQLERSAP